MFHQGLQQRKSVFNLQEVKMQFSAMSPLPLGQMMLSSPPSDLRFWVENQWQTRAARMMLVEVKAMTSPSPRKMYHVLECFWGSSASTNKQKEENLVICWVGCVPTHWIYCILVSNCQHLSTWSVMVSTFQEVPKHPGEMLAVDKVKRLCKTSWGLNQGLLGIEAVIVCCPVWQAMAFLQEWRPR